MSDFNFLFSPSLSPAISNSVNLNNHILKKYDKIKQSKCSTIQPARESIEWAARHSPHPMTLSRPLFEHWPRNSSTAPTKHTIRKESHLMRSHLRVRRFSCQLTILTDSVQNKKKKARPIATNTAYSKRAAETSRSTALPSKRTHLSSAGQAAPSNLRSATSSINSSASSSTSNTQNWRKQGKMRLSRRLPLPLKQLKQFQSAATTASRSFAPPHRSASSTSRVLRILSTGTWRFCAAKASLTHALKHMRHSVSLEKDPSARCVCRSTATPTTSSRSSPSTRLR